MFPGINSSRSQTRSFSSKAPSWDVNVLVTEHIRSTASLVDFSSTCTYADLCSVSILLKMAPRTLQKNLLIKKGLDVGG